MTALWKAVLAIYILAVSSLSGAAAQNPDAETVLRAREAALAAGDFDAVLGLFADDAVVVSSSGRLLIGKEQVKVWVQDQIERRQREEAGARSVQGNKLSWAGKVYREDWQKLGVSPLDVNQDAIIQSGRIKFFNTTFTPESGAKLRAARKGDKSAVREQLAPTGKVWAAVAVGSTANTFRATLDSATGRPRGVAIDHTLGEKLYGVSA